MTNEIITTRRQSLDLCGNRENVRGLAERIEMMMPGGVKCNTEQALTLSQMSVAYGLDVFNGEIWLIKGEGENAKVYGALVGIKGLRKKAKEQANYWGVNGSGGFERVTDPKKLQEYNVPDGGICYEYRITDDVIIEGWTEALDRLTKIGFTLEQAQSMVGPMPVTIGVGIWEPSERTKMKPHQAAMYRAEKDALKRRFDVSFYIPANGKSLPDNAHEIAEQLDAIDGEVVEPSEPDAVEQERDEEEILSELGFTTPPRMAQRQPDNTVKEKMAEKNLLPGQEHLI